MIDRIIDLYKSKRELTLLQSAYVIIAVVSFLIAGIFALFNQALGIGVLIIPLISFVAFIVNTVTWSLVKSLSEYLIEHKAEVKGKTKAIANKISKKS